MLLLTIIIYLIPTTIFFLMLDDDRISSLVSLAKYNSKSLTKLVIVLFFLNMAGLPPLPGFFFKLNLFVIFFKKYNLAVSAILAVLNYTSFYLYLGCLKGSFVTKKAKNSIKWTGKKVKLCFLFIYFVLGFVFAKTYIIIILLSSCL